MYNNERKRVSRACKNSEREPPGAMASTCIRIDITHSLRLIARECAVCLAGRLARVFSRTRMCGGIFFVWVYSVVCREKAVSLLRGV